MRLKTLQTTLSERNQNKLGEKQKTKTDGMGSTKEVEVDEGVCEVMASTMP